MLGILLQQVKLAHFTSESYLFYHYLNASDTDELNSSTESYMIASYF